MKDIFFANCIVTVPDEIGQSIAVNGRTWTFDFDEMFGPLWTRADGTERKNQNPNKLVWAAFERWRKARLLSP